MVGGSVVGDGDAADRLLVIADLFQAAISVKVALVAVLVRDAVFLITGAGGCQNQRVIDLVFVGTGRGILEVSAGTVLVFPNIIGAVFRPLVDPLVIVCAPAIAQAVVVV